MCTYNWNNTLIVMYTMPRIVSVDGNRINTYWLVLLIVIILLFCVLIVTNCLHFVVTFCYHLASLLLCLLLALSFSISLLPSNCSHFITICYWVTSLVIILGVLLITSLTIKNRPLAYCLLASMVQVTVNGQFSYEKANPNKKTQ